MELLDDLVRFFLSALGDEPTRREWKNKHPSVCNLVNALRQMGDLPKQKQDGREYQDRERNSPLQVIINELAAIPDPCIRQPECKRNGRSHLATKKPSPIILENMKMHQNEAKYNAPFS
jgi:hypothetical protein